MKSVLNSLLVILLCFSLSGCTLASELTDNDICPEDDDIIHLALDEMPSDYDVQNGGCEQIARYNFSRLVKICDHGDGSSGIEPDLCESWEISPDGLTYTFHLLEGVLFHNEREFESDDILFTIDRMLNTGREDQIPESFLRLRGAADVLNRNADSIEGLGVFVTDKYTVEMELTEPYAPFLEELADTSWSVYNRDAEDGNDRCTGTGPFIPEIREDEQTVFLTKFNHYFGEEPSFSGILFTAVSSRDEKIQLFTDGKLDIIRFDTDQDTIDAYLQDPVCSEYVVVNKTCRICFYCMNQNLAPFSDLRIRKGLQLCIDRNSILNTVFRGQGQLLNGIIPEGMFFFDRAAGRIKYNKEDALELFGEAGYAEGFGLTICQSGDSDEETMINELVCQHMKSCGINAVVRTMDKAAFLSAKSSGILPMYLAAVSTERKDPDLFIHSCFGQIGNSRWSLNNPDTDLTDKIENAHVLSDQTLRGEIYNAVNTVLVYDEAVIIPMFQIYTYTLVNPRITNYSSITENVAVVSIR